MQRDPLVYQSASGHGWGPFAEFRWVHDYLKSKHRRESQMERQLLLMCNRPNDPSTDLVSGSYHVKPDWRSVQIVRLRSEAANQRNDASEGL